MKRFEDTFYELYELHSTGLDHGSGERSARSTYQNVLRKAGLSPARRGGGRAFRVLLAAAVLATAALTIAATAYRVSDAFRGVLEVHDSAASAPGASAPDSIIERTGSVVGEKRESGGLEMQLRAAVSSERDLKLLLDVTVPSGEPLAIRQPDGSLSDGAFSLGNYTLSRADGRPLSGGARFDFLDSGSDDSRTTILLQYSISDENIRDQELRLCIADLLQFATLDGTPLAMEADHLHELLGQFGPYGEGDFRLSDYSEEKGDEYLLNAADSGNALPLSEDCPGVVVTGAAVRQGALYLQGRAADQAELERILYNAVLINPATGAAVPGGAISWGDMESGGTLPWSIRFDGVESVESMRGFAWSYGAGEGFHTAHKGEWNFSFRVESEDVALHLSPDLAVIWENHPLTVTALEISPYSLFLRYSTDEATARRMVPADIRSRERIEWSESERAVTLTMLDGSTLRVRGGSLATGESPTEFEMHYLLDAVIDPAQVAAVQLGEQTLQITR